MRRGNIQHGRRRRMPWSIRLPIAVLVVLIPILIWQLTWLIPNTL